jgi:hypothetical protein
MTVTGRLRTQRRVIAAGPFGWSKAWVEPHHRVAFATTSTSSDAAP